MPNLNICVYVPFNRMIYKVFMRPHHTVNQMKILWVTLTLLFAAVALVFAYGVPLFDVLLT